MSLISKPVVTPSCVRAVFRYLALTGESDRNRLESLLSPDSLLDRGDRDRVRSTINESVRMGLLSEDGLVVRLNPNLPDEARDPETGDKELPDTLCHLIFDAERDANRDLARAMAWFLSQDVYDPPGIWPEFQKKLTDQLGGERFGLNDLRYGQFVAWACFLGFAWTHKVGTRRKIVVPDPTAFIRRNLGVLFISGGELPIAAFMQNLKELSPAFEGGALRKSVEETFVRLEEGHLSTVTSSALFRLRDEGHINLVMLKDAEPFVLRSAREEERISHVRKTA